MALPLLLHIMPFISDTIVLIIHKIRLFACTRFLFNEIRTKIDKSLLRILNKNVIDDKDMLSTNK